LPPWWPALFGGVAQTTPYIGHPAYKAMGGRAAYTLAAGLFVRLGGMLGAMALVIGAIPEAVLTPILLFVASKSSRRPLPNRRGNTRRLLPSPLFRLWRISCSPMRTA
jgi:hypothetical protein